MPSSAAHRAVSKTDSNKRKNDRSSTSVCIAAYARKTPEQFQIAPHRFARQDRIILIAVVK
jgi:hypothetical protein